MNSDIFLLSVGPPSSSISGYWRVLAEWPSSIFQGDGFSERCNHSMSHRSRTEACAAGLGSTAQRGILILT